MGHDLETGEGGVEQLRGECGLVGVEVPVVGTGQSIGQFPCEGDIAEDVETCGLEGREVGELDKVEDGHCQVDAGQKRGHAHQAQDDFAELAVFVGGEDEDFGTLVEGYFRLFLPLQEEVVLLQQLLSHAIEAQTVVFEGAEVGEGGGECCEAGGDVAPVLQIGGDLGVAELQDDGDEFGPFAVVVVDSVADVGGEDQENQGPHPDAHQLVAAHLKHQLAELRVQLHFGAVGHAVVLHEIAVEFEVLCAGAVDFAAVGEGHD